MNIDPERYYTRQWFIKNRFFGFKSPDANRKALVKYESILKPRTYGEGNGARYEYLGKNIIKLQEKL